MEILNPTRELARLILHALPGLGSGVLTVGDEPTHSACAANETEPPSVLFCSVLFCSARSLVLIHLPVPLPASLIPGGAPIKLLCLPHSPEERWSVPSHGKEGMETGPSPSCPAGLSTFPG